MDSFHQSDKVVASFLGANWITWNSTLVTAVRFALPLSSSSALAIPLMLTIGDPFSDSRLPKWGLPFGENRCRNGHIIIIVELDFTLFYWIWTKENNLRIVQIAMAGYFIDSQCGTAVNNDLF